ncbi:hypothetical protein GQ53DRAFT_531251 [Thozetella sp. PMI_491]|nr:hypothetical protein GQ53DRAFT_531251 [Thozetella sp. PMI_491]
MENSPRAAQDGDIDGVATAAAGPKLQDAAFPPLYNTRQTESWAQDSLYYEELSQYLESPRCSDFTVELNASGRDMPRFSARPARTESSQPPSLDDRTPSIDDSPDRSEFKREAREVVDRAEPRRLAHYGGVFGESHGLLAGLLGNKRPLNINERDLEVSHDF